MANEFDKIFRETFKCPKHNLLKQLLPTEAESIRAMPTKVQQTIVEREADTVFEIQPVSGETYLLHIEWQSTNDKQMAFRMAKYNMLLTETYGIQVMGIMIYVGEKPMTIVNTYASFGHQYCCPFIDIRDFSPETFLSSNDSDEVLLAILAGREDGVAVVKRIFAKLRILTAGDITLFKEKVRRLELIAQLRGIDLQKQIIKEEGNMPITFDITKDLKYKLGVESGEKKGIEKNNLENARKMLAKGIDISIVHEITEIPTAELKKLKTLVYR
ncbi:conserved hypothetical protein (putative transposase or invertase) [Filimonas lacunae]|uniref:Transposase (putative) YhgA-like domain-containing protein n=1 Tax=Filimonas lacunae TaxID=477680 RepID=A0A173MGR9_9BACT|nr:Rpn family recombination-promoting nuclease/putative transposase [Filimonas lacunae]BAV06667.1 transposase [Filimonas lacunae]SIT27829.1 conserved hypothetical protein (putative transposase or invertase) [Filimonas lacunae]